MTDGYSDLSLRRLLKKTSILTGVAFIESAARSLADELGASIVFVTRLNSDRPGWVDILAGTKRGYPLQPWTVDIKGTPCEGIYDSYNPAVDTRGVFTGIVRINRNVSNLFLRAKRTQAQAFVGIPLWNCDQMIGHVAMFFDNPLDLDARDSELVEIAALFAERIQAELLRLIHDDELRHVMRKLVSVNRKLKAQATHDNLSGLMNRACLKEKLSQLSSTSHSGFFFAMGDVDNFKLINDQFGHEQGDIVLLQLSKRLRCSLRRQTDLLFRMGGEEFAVLIPAQRCCNYHSISSRLLDASRFHPQGNRSLDITCSWGLMYATDPNLEALYSRSDDLLYQAKNTGKNRVVCDQSNEATFFEPTNGQIISSGVFQ